MVKAQKQDGTCMGWPACPALVMTSTQMRIMTLIPHEPRWLPTGCSGKPGTM
jgi:hypothetical protein